MTFIWPGMLWALWVIPLVLWGALRSARRRRSVETRLADARLYSHITGAPSPWRLRIPLALYVIALALLLLATARPVAAIPLPVNRAAVMLTIDTSQSMMATDVNPTRLEAAKAAARMLLGVLPRSVQVGLVSFSDVGTVLVPPSHDRSAVEDALDRLQPQQSTSVGSAIVEALAALPDRKEFLGERLSQLRNIGPQDPQAQATPPGGGLPAPAATDLPPAVIIVFSDGVSNTGVDPRIPVALASAARVKIHAIGYGQEGGAVMSYGGGLILVPFDGASLQRLAQQAGGEYVRSTDEVAIRRLARQIGYAVAWERRRGEVTAVFAAGAGLLMLTGMGLSLAWFRRAP
jgi:Ca-activated chloride channel family protein